MIMVAGVCGITGAFAEEAVLQALPAKNGFPSAVDLEIRGGSNWGEAKVAWTAFSNTADANFTYAKLRAKNPATARIVWEVIAYEKVNGVEDQSKPVAVTVQPDKLSAVGQVFKVYQAWDSSVSEEVLYIEQGTVAYYGTMKVTATVIVTETGGDVVAGSAYSPQVTVILSNQVDYNKLIEQAKAIAAKTDRYKSDYLKTLNEAIDAALFYNSTKPSEETINRIMSGLKAIVDQASSNYKLTGQDWFDKIFPQWLIKAFWDIKDSFQPIVNFLGQIGNAFKAIMPFFSFFFGLFGL